MWQKIGVIIVGLLTVGYFGWKIFRSLTSSRRPSDSPCGGCSGCGGSSGCSLKKEMIKNGRKGSFPISKQVKS